jgi:BirA family biotin operon repressor/biotin-[acetyl-CoA-carboxylase] ligase
MTDRLPDDVAAALAAAGGRLGAFSQIQYAADVTSTNDLAIALAGSGAPEGTAVLADSQRAGRGRRGRSWFSPPGAGVYLSVVVRPRGITAALSLVTLAAGVAAVRGIAAATGLTVELKWPNDLVMGRPWRKLGGILCEGVGGSPISAVVIGTGINLRASAFPREIADHATALEVELGRVCDRGVLVAELLASLSSEIGTLWGGNTGRITDAWRGFGRTGLGGAAVRWHDGRGERRGVARDIDDSGALIVETDGRAERLVAGEVTWEKYSRD